MLRLVAIYEINPEENSFKVVQHSKPKRGFFATREQEIFEEKILPEIMQDLSSEKLYNKPLDGCFHYARWAPETRHLHVVISTRDLASTTKTAPHYLLTNVRHVDERPTKVRATLEDIRLNYIGYIENDILIKQTHDGLMAVRAQLLKNVEAALLRGELLENLEPKAEDLAESSKKLKLQASDLKNSYRCCGI